MDDRVAAGDGARDVGRVAQIALDLASAADWIALVGEESSP